MRDSDIRSVLWLRLEREHQGDADTLMLDELSLWHGSTRIDVAVINGEMQGYELKSEQDTLERLKAQAEIYSATLDRVTLVVAEKHANKAIAAVPDWWGVMLACKNFEGVGLSIEREAKKNPAIDPFSVATLLWRQEAMDELVRLSADKGVRGKSRDHVYLRLTEVLSQDQLCTFVRRTLKDRCSWRADRRQTLCGG